MASPHKNWTLPTVGADDNTWGAVLNTVINDLDSMLGDATAVATTGGATSLTQTQQNSAGFLVTGTLVSNATIEFLAKGGVWVIRNGCTGAFTLTAKVAGQTGIVLPQGATKLIWNNGTDIVDVTAFALDIVSLAALDPVALDDTIPIYDLSATANKRLTPVILLNVLNLLTADAAPDGIADYLLGWDNSAGTVKKVLHSQVRPREAIIIPITGDTTALAAGTGKATFRMPWAFAVTAVRASLVTAQTSGGVVTVDINDGGTTILSTKLTLDNNEKTSTTAATPAVISDAALADDAEITVDIDSIGNGTAKGLKVTLIGYRTG